MMLMMKSRLELCMKKLTSVAMMMPTNAISSMEPNLVRSVLVV